jgi:WD40 repeat protein
MSISTRAVPSPFKFLDAYTKKDGDVFFGRDAEIEQLYQSVNKNRIVLVYGQSGTGKTSLVQCGLSNRFEVTDWVPFWIRRGKDINRALQQALSQSKALGGAEVNQENLFRSLERLSKRYVRPIYLIFDQFEELLLLGDEEEKRLFLQTIKTILSDETTEACHLLFIIREEYFGWLESFEAAIPGFSDRRLRVEPMRPDRLDEVIVQSCAAFNISLQTPKENTRQIRECLRTKSGIALPYLQVFLDQLYREDYVRTYPEGWEGEGYPALHFETEEIIKMGAITDIMERLLDDRSESIQRELTQRFPELPADFVEEVLDNFATFEGTKRPLSYRRNALGQIELSGTAPVGLKNMPPAPLQFCLEALESNRLLRADEDTFELAHDSLAALIDQQRSDEQRRINEVYRQIHGSFQVYQDTQTDFLSRNQLALYENYLPQLELEPELEKFLDESRRQIALSEQADRQKLAEERELRKSAEDNARRAGTLTRRALAFALIAILAAAWALIANQRTERAKDALVLQIREANAAALVARSRKAFYDNHNLAWQLAARGYQLFQTPETALALRDMSYATQPATGIISRHSGRINALAYSRDGQYLLSASTDRTILRTQADGSDPVRLSEDFGEVNRVAFSPDGKMAALGTETGLQIWDLDRKELVHHLKEDITAVWELAYAPDGSKIAIGGMDFVGIYDLNDSTYRQLTRTQGLVFDLAFSSDGQRLAIANISEPPSIRTLDGRIRTTFRIPDGESVTKLAFTPDDRFVITGDSKGEVRRWRSDAGYSEVLKPRGTFIKSLVVRSAHEILAGDIEGAMYLWHRPGQEEPQAYLLDRNMFVEAVAFSPDDRHILAADIGGNLLSWPAPIRISADDPAPDEISSLIILDSTRYLSGDLSGKVRLWNPPDSTRTITQMDGVVSALAYSPAASLLAVGNTFGEIVFCAADGSSRRLIRPSEDEVAGLQFAPDGQSLVVSYGVFADAQLLDLEGKVLLTFPGSAPTVQTSFSPDGQLIMMSAPEGGEAGTLYHKDGTLILNNFTHQVYDSGQGKLVETGTLACAFTPDGQRIITVGGNGKIKIWDLKGQEILNFSDGSQVWDLAVSPDGRYLSNFNSYGDATIWTIEGTKVQDFKTRDRMNAVIFSPDSRYIIIAGEAGVPKKIALWQAVLEESAISRISLYENSALSRPEEDPLDKFLETDEQAELVNYGAYFKELYENDAQPEYLTYVRRLYNKAIAATLENKPGALSAGWWERHLTLPLGDRPGRSELEGLFAELKGQLE